MSVLIGGISLDNCEGSADNFIAQCVFDAVFVFAFFELLLKIEAVISTAFTAVGYGAAQKGFHLFVGFV